MRLDIEVVIYAYLFICLALLFFDLGYIFCSKHRGLHLKRRSLDWESEVQTQMKRLTEGLPPAPAHTRMIETRLVRIGSLSSFGAALDRLGRKDGELTARYMYACQGSLQVVASHYMKRDSMERAYLSYLISRHRPCYGEEYRPLMDILLEFLDGSTVYCRENTLKALYALWNCQAVENALQLLNDRQVFHHTKLLSDGLLTFSGDREKLASRLWRHRKEWSEELMLAVIQFITGFTGQYREVFLPVLQAKDTGMEIRLALLRYYRRHPYEPVRPLLLSNLTGNEAEENIQIVSAAVLARYPGTDTVRTLNESLHHPNWYVRYNAAQSLVELKTPPEELEEILKGEDQYAREILTYMLEDADEGGDGHG